MNNKKLKETLSDILQKLEQLGRMDYKGYIKLVREIHRKTIENIFDCNSELLQLNIMLFSIESDKSLCRLLSDLYSVRSNIYDTLWAFVEDRITLKEFLVYLKRSVNPITYYCNNERYIRCEDCPYANRFPEGTCKCKYNYFYDKMLSMLGDKDEPKSKST